MYEDRVSKAEYNSMEKRQNEILDEVRPIKVKYTTMVAQLMLIF